MYHALYKCRLCHKKYSIPISKEESDSLENSTFTNNDMATVQEHKPLHRCKNGIGIADFQGFQKVSD
jgi:hypothetical protein